MSPSQPVPFEVPTPAETAGPGPSRDIGQIFREHNQTLVRYLRVRLGSDQEAMEVAQEAYVKLLQLERTGAISFMRAYLFKIAANLAIDRIRQRNAHGRHEDIDLFQELEDAAATERSVMAQEELDMIGRCLDELPERCAHAFVLSRMHGMGPQEIAASMGISDRMVRGHILRALVYFKLRLDGTTPEDALAATRT